MNCRDARELLFAFLDNELDAQANIDLQLHLEHCCACARDAEIEREIRKRLVAVMESGIAAGGPDSAAIRATLQGAWDAENPAPRPALHRRRVLVPAAALIAAVASVLFVWRPWSATGATGVEVARLPFATTAVVQDFEHFLDVGEALHVVGDDPTVVGQWMARELRRPVEMPVMRGTCRLVGARRCSSFEDPAAFALYEIDGAPAALVVTRAPMDMAPGRSVDSAGGHTVLMLRQGDLAYAAVGRQGEAELSELLPHPASGR